MALRVIVPSRYEDLLGKFLASLEAAQPGSSKVVIVLDNGLSPNFRVQWPTPCYVQVEADPFRYAYSINVGAEVATPHDTLILGDDMLMLTPNWLDAVELFMLGWPREYGAINIAHKPGIPAAPTESDVAHGLGITMIPRWVWDRIGPWDERYDGGYGYEDIDYCLQLFHRGLKIGVSGVAVAAHSGTVTWRRKLGSYEAVIAKCHQSRVLFQEKWGMPNDEEIKHLPAAEHLAGTCGCRR